MKAIRLMYKDDEYQVRLVARLCASNRESYLSNRINVCSVHEVRKWTLKREQAPLTVIRERPVLLAKEHLQILKNLGSQDAHGINVGREGVESEPEREGLRGTRILPSEVHPYESSRALSSRQSRIPLRRTGSLQTAEMDC